MSKKYLYFRGHVVWVLLFAVRRGSKVADPATCNGDVTGLAAGQPDEDRREDDGGPTVGEPADRGRSKR